MRSAFWWANRVLGRYVPVIGPLVLVDRFMFRRFKDLLSKKGQPTAHKTQSTMKRISAPSRLSNVFVLTLLLRTTSAWTVPLPPATTTTPASPVVVSTITTSSTTPSSVFVASSSPLTTGLSSWFLLSSDDEVPPPSPQDIQLLRQAFAEYSAGNYKEALPLLNDVVGRWDKSQQPADERAALYKTRADLYAATGEANRAISDYDTSLQLYDVFDVERPGVQLGRARALKAMGRTTAAATDYRTVLQTLGTDDVYDDETTPAIEQILNGIDKNPFAAWEYADCLRSEKQYAQAGAIREAASRAFRQIGDAGRSVIALTDAGIDYAGDTAQSSEKAITVLRKAVDATKGVEGRDVKLLQRIISKEGEGRMALAALLWTTNEKNAAETVLGDACVRMDQLLNQMDGTPPPSSSGEPSKALRYSMEDDDQLVGSLTCTRFKNKQFLASKLRWPESLQERVLKLESLR